MEHLDIKVKGKVQGVFYRVNTQRTANSLGIKGMVKNMVDGSVLIEAEGNLEQLNTFVAWCKQGPVTAQVKEVAVAKGAVKNYSSFNIQ